MIEVSLDEDDDVLEMLEESRQEQERKLEESRREQKLIADVRAAIAAKDIDMLEVTLAAVSKSTVSKSTAGHAFIAGARRTLAGLRLDRAVNSGHVENIEDAILGAAACGMGYSLLVAGLRYLGLG